MSEKPTEGDGDPAQTPISRVTCGGCNKKNSVQIYADGSEVCFTKGCGHRKGRTWQPPTKAIIPPGLIRPRDGAFQRLSARNLDQDTLRRYGTFVAGHGGESCLIAPLYNDTGEMVAQLARKGDGTTATLYPTGDRVDADTTQLYGRHVYGDSKDRKVIVTSDRLDAMSVGQVTRFRVPAVSVNAGAEAASRSIKANYRWLDRFAEIVLFFQPGVEWDRAAQQCAALFDAGKVKIAKLDEHHTINAALVANRGGDIDQAVWSASTWRPVGIINARDGLADILAGGIQVAAWPYPWPCFNDQLLGMRPGEVSYHVGGTGIAKTTLMLHYAQHLLMWEGKTFTPGTPTQPPCKIGWFGFEDNLKSVKLGLLSIHTGRRLHLNPVPNDEAALLYADLFGSGLMEMYDAENAEYGLQAILGYMKYMVRALDCKIVFIDPMTYLVAGLPSANRTQAEDQVAAELATIARSTGVHIHIGYHLKKADGTPFEEGGEVRIQDIKGSGALYQFSNNVYAYERDQQGERTDLLRVRVLKQRAIGITGVIAMLKYDMDTGRYAPTKDKWPPKKTDVCKGFPAVSSSDEDFK
jgi:twinkle protein